MSLRFRKTFTIFPGVRLNIARKSLSVSVGRDGATVNLGKDGVKGTVGLPGSGLSYSKVLLPRRALEGILGGGRPAQSAPRGASGGSSSASQTKAPPALRQSAPAPSSPSAPEQPARSGPGKRFGGAYSPRPATPAPQPAPPAAPEPRNTLPAQDRSASQDAPLSPRVPPSSHDTPPGAEPLPPRSARRQASAMVPIVSAPVEELTSPSLEGLHEMMRKAAAQRRLIESDLAEARAELRARQEGAASEAAVEEARTEIARLQDWLADSRIDAQFAVPASAHDAWEALEEAFDRLRRSDSLWDVTAARAHDPERGPLREVERARVQADYATFPLLAFARQALKFGNANGEEILIYPALAMIPAQDGSFAVIDARDLRIAAEVTPVPEPGELPADAKVVRHIPGGRGKPDIPVCDYGRLTLRSTTGLDEEYLVSDADAALGFAAAFAAYADALDAGPDEDMADPVSAGAGPPPIPPDAP